MLSRSTAATRRSSTSASRRPVALSAFAELPFAELLGELGERTPAPGGGAAAAWTGAIAAALLQMASQFAGDDGTAAEAQTLREVLLEAADRDLRSYEPVLAARRRPAEDPERTTAIRDALTQASEAPLAIADAAARVAALASDVAAASEPDLRGDAETAQRLAEAASRCASGLVATNERMKGRLGGHRGGHHAGDS